MHLFATASLKNRALVALVTIVTVVFGVISMTGLKQELMPSVQFPTIAVLTTYPGASPEVVNEDVSLPIETAVRGVPGAESTSSTSSTGASMVLVEFEYGIDLAATEQKVERAISRIQSVLPPDLDPQVISGSIDDFPVIQIAVNTADSGSLEDLTALIETVALPKLEDVDGVRQVQLLGVPGERVTITPDADELEASGFTTQHIRDALQQNGILLPAGSITEEEFSLAVQVGGAISSVDEVRALPLVPSAEAFFPEPETGAGDATTGFDASMFGGGAALQQDTTPSEPVSPEILTIGDIATVELEPNPETSISRVNGEPAITIAVTKLSAANTVEVSHAVRALFPDIEDALEGASLTVVFDQAPYIEESVETLSTEGLLGLAFAVLVILVFLLSIRATLVTAISIPTSLLLTFIALNFADYTLNLLTLGALTISIGRVVDDSIVVIENIKRHLAPGLDRMRTIITAVREVAGAITSSTIATIAVFLPMAFVGGTVGELFRPFAFTIGFALAASLFVSLTIVPVLAYWFLKPDRVKAEESVGEERITKIQRSYLPIIDWTLKRPIVTLLAAVVVLGGTVAATPLMKTNFIGADEQNAFNIQQTLAPGTSLDAQLIEAERVEAVLADVADVETVQVSLGGGGGMEALFGGGGDGVISYAVTTDTGADQGKLQDEIRERVEALDEAGEFSISASSGGFGGSSTVAVDISAPNQQLLAEGTGLVVDALRAHSAFSQVESNLGESRPTLEIQVDRTAAAAAGLSEIAVASLVSGAMTPSSIGQLILEEQSVSVYLSQGDAPATRDEVAAITVPTVLGEKRLDELANVEVVDGPVTVTSMNASRSATIDATPASDDLTVASAAVTEVLAEVELPGGVTAEIGGVLTEQSEAFEQLGLALLAAILIVYVIMVATFKSLLQPLLLLVSVPFAATGAIGLLIATGIPLGVASLIGVLMLVGIVVTNAIVLIDLVNQLRRRGHSLVESVRLGSARRFRPIVMTALATIFALTPMALGITGKGGFISQPLAVVVIGGLLSSTVLTLIVLPTLYYAVERRRLKAVERRQLRAARRAVEAEGELYGEGA